MTRNNLWAPWRIAYIQGLSPEEKPTETDCFLCEAAASDTDTDRQDRLVLLHDDRGMLLLNRYPYTNGHLLIAPPQHVGDLSDLSAAQRHGLMDLADLATRLLRRAMNPQGFNIGINLGRCAGAGLPGHVHMHVVPRWSGDINYMDTLGGIRVIPQALENTQQLLTDTLAQL